MFGMIQTFDFGFYPMFKLKYKHILKTEIVKVQSQNNSVSLTHSLLGSAALWEPWSP
jgi:hypothetical protein